MLNSSSSIHSLCLYLDSMRLAVELLLAAIVLAAPSSLKDLCGWPSLAPGGLFGPPTVRLAQRMLGYALGDP